MVCIIRIRAALCAFILALCLAPGQTRAASSPKPARGPLPPLSAIKAARFKARDGVLVNDSAENTGEAVLMFVGDLMALSAQQNAARSGGNYNFNGSFEHVRGIFAQADFVMGNLETMLSHTFYYTHERKKHGRWPLCNAPSTYLDALRYAGFDAVATANNHCADAGDIGIEETHGLLDRYQIAHTGTFRFAAEPRFLLADVNGIRIAIMSYSDVFNKKDRNIPKDKRDVMLNAYGEARVVRDVRAAKRAGAEFIVAYTHWGRENTHNVTREQTRHAKEMADAGVDLILGSHPHCLQRAQTITAADGREALCIYSLGNFVSSMEKAINNDTIAARVQLKRRGDTVALADAAYYPCYVMSSRQSGRFVVTPVDPKLNGGLSNASLKSARARIAKAMGGELSEIIA